MSANKPVLIIVAGPNGSGKTSITEKLLKHHWFDNCEYINPDAIAEKKFGGWNDYESIIKAAEEADRLRDLYLLERKNFVFETVFSHQSKIDFIQKAKEAGYFVRLLFVSTNHPRINAARIVDRVLQGGHDVPIKKIISRYANSINNGITASAIVDRAYFYDNSFDNLDATLLAKLKDGVVNKKYLDDYSQFTWFSKVLEAIENKIPNPPMSNADEKLNKIATSHRKKP